jgi:CRP-like cAMP-binding protein
MENLWAGNALLASMKAGDLALIGPHLKPVEFRRGDVVFEPGDKVDTTFFPTTGSMIALTLAGRGDRAIEVATIGNEGAFGDISSVGRKPAFARVVVRSGGLGLHIDTARLKDAKDRSDAVRDLFDRYMDALLAQTLQSVACNALHTIEERCCRWLLATQDRVPTRTLPLTQEFLAERLGAQRTTVSVVAKELQRKGLIHCRRGQITIVDKAALEEAACQCYAAVAEYYRAILPNVKGAHC